MQVLLPKDRPIGGINREKRAHKVKHPFFWNMQNFRYNLGTATQVERLVANALYGAPLNEDFEDYNQLPEFSSNSPLPAYDPSVPPDPQPALPEYSMYLNNATGYTDVYNQNSNTIVSNHTPSGPYNFNIGECATDIDGVVYFVTTNSGFARLMTFQADGTQTIMGTSPIATSGVVRACVITGEGRIVALIDHYLFVMFAKDGTYLASTTINPGAFPEGFVTDRNDQMWIWYQSANLAGNWSEAISIKQATLGTVVFGDNVTTSFASACVSLNRIHVFTQTFFGVGPIIEYNVDTGIKQITTNTPPVRMYGVSCNVEGTKFWGGQKNDVFGIYLFYYDALTWGTVDAQRWPKFTRVHAFDQSILYVWDQAGAIQRWNIGGPTPVYLGRTIDLNVPAYPVLFNNWVLRKIVLGL